MALRSLFRGTRTAFASAALFSVLLTSTAFAASPVLDDCDAWAGTITMDEGPHCLVDGAATLVAYPVGAVVPAGFTTLYVLTRTNGLIIEQVNVDPVFTVNEVAVWRIHTLVYDPGTLDLSFIQFGGTYAYELQSLITQGGGDICASFTISGAPCKTAECEEACTAHAGTISADQPDLCLIDGVATLEATPDGNAFVPDGYSVLYLLTVVPDPVIINAATQPSFTVTVEGPFSILALVYDPATFDPSTIEFGVTNAADLNAQFLQGGGAVCASLDLTGAEFFVADCTPTCNAYAGTLTADEAELCLENGSATMSATPNGDAVVPDGFSVAYILTQGVGLIIQNVEPDPDFEWPLVGEYTIHTLVYDPFTLDPYAVQLGVTTAFEINEVLIQGGGPICGSLDLAGAQFTIIECAPPCVDDAGIGGDVILCYNEPAVELFSLLTGTPEVGGTWTGPNGEPFVGLFDPSTDDQGIYVYFVTDGPNCPGDTAQVVISLIECGDPCTADAGESAEITVCDTDAPFVCILELGGSPDQGGFWTDPNGAAFSGEFDPATDLQGIYTYTVPQAAPCEPVSATLTITVEECAPPCNAGLDAESTVCITDPPFSLFGLLAGDVCAGGSWINPAGNPVSGMFDPSSDVAGVYMYLVEYLLWPNDTANVTVIVIECADPCAGSSPDAGIGGDILLCDTDAPLELFSLLTGTPDVGGVWTAPDGSASNGEFDPASSLLGIYVYTVFDLPDCTPDTTQLVIYTIPCGGGGELDVISNERTNGNSSTTDETGISGLTITGLSPWPNPAVDQLRVAIPIAVTAGARVHVIDELGRTASVPFTISTGLLTLDVRALPAGSYQLRLMQRGGVLSGRFVRARE